MLLFDRVEKKINDQLAMKNITFNLYQKDYLTIYADKFSPLHGLKQLICGEIQPDGGLIRSLDTSVGLVCRNFNMVSKRSIKENLFFLAGLRGHSREKIEPLLDVIMDLTGLSCVKDEKFVNLAYHQQIRTNLAAAMMFLPEIILLEDPFENIDEVNTLSLQHLIEDINERGISILHLTTSKKDLIKNKSGKKLKMNISTDGVTIDDAK